MKNNNDYITHHIPITTLSKYLLGEPHFMISKSLIQQSQVYKDNPGCTEAQIFNLTEKVVRLSSHLKNHNKDYSSQRGLKIILGQRKRLLSYLYRQDNTRYETLINQLGIRVPKKK